MLEELKLKKYYPESIIGKSICDKVMVSQDGLYVYAKGYKLAENVHNALQELCDKNYIVKAKEHVSLSIDHFSTLRDYIGSHGDKEHVSEELLKRMKSLFAKCAEAEVADLQLHIIEDRTKIFIITATNKLLIDVWTRKDGEDFLNVVYQAADVRDQRSAKAKAIFTYNYLNTVDAKEKHPFRIPDSITGFRAAQAPNIGGYHWTARLFYARHSSTNLTLYDIITDPDDQAILEQKMLENRGGFFIAGATGEGKSTTSLKYEEMLFEHFDGTKNFVELGNPIEQINTDIIQISVEETDGDGDIYTQYMRHLMRTHPHWGNIQEIRDLPQAKIFFDFLQSGHPGLTTFHGDTACAVPFRLIDIGMDPRVVAAPGRIALLMRQILVYELCEHCAIEAKPNNIKSPMLRKLLTEQNMFGKAKIRNFQGCEHCRISGDFKSQIWNGHKKLSVIPEFLVPDATWLSFVRDQDQLRAYEYWMIEMGARTINARLREMINEGRVDPVVAVTRGAFDSIDLQMHRRTATKEAAE